MKSCLTFKELNQMYMYINLYFVLSEEYITILKRKGK